MTWMLDEVGIEVEAKSHGLIIHHESGAHLYLPDEKVDRLSTLCREAATMYRELADDIDAETEGSA